MNHGRVGEPGLAMDVACELFGGGELPTAVVRLRKNGPTVVPVKGGGAARLPLPAPQPAGLTVDVDGGGASSGCATVNASSNTLPLVVSSDG